MIKVLCLDMENTIISNAMSQFPRYGLHAFLTWCFQTFPRVAIFTCLSEEKTRSILEQLHAENCAPENVLSMEYIQWDRKQTHAKKDLRHVSDATPEECIIVDDVEDYVLPEQRDRLVHAFRWETPYKVDSELERIRGELQMRLDALASQRMCDDCEEVLATDREISKDLDWRKCKACWDKFDDEITAEYSSVKR